MNCTIPCLDFGGHEVKWWDRVFATRKDLVELRAALNGDMQTEKRLSTVEADARAHYKNCDERGERLEKTLRAMVNDQAERHAENQKAIGGLYSRFWAAAAAVIVTMAAAIGYLLTHGLPYQVIPGHS